MQSRLSRAEPNLQDLFRYGVPFSIATLLWLLVVGASGPKKASNAIFVNIRFILHKPQVNKWMNQAIVNLLINWTDSSVEADGPFGLGEQNKSLRQVHSC